MNKKMKKIGLLMSAALLGMAGEVFAATPLSVAVNGSQYMEAPGITRLAVGNPEIADVNLLSSHDFLLVGKKAGSTTLLVWSNKGREEYNVFVSAGDAGTAEAIQQAIGYPGVKVQMMNGKALLRGRVRNQYEHDSALKVAALYMGSDVTEPTSDENGTTKLKAPNVIDLMDMTDPSQIRLEAQIIEINTSNEKELGIQYWSPQIGDANSGSSNSGNGSYDVNRGSSGLFYAGENFRNSRGGTLGWFGRRLSNINASLQALVTNGKARILSRPSITTMSGEKAKILIGGQIPIPVSNGDGDVTIEWRDYGIHLEIEPVVDSQQKITSKVHAEVSSLDYSHGVKEREFNIPGIATREAEAVINVGSGMTMAIGGLLNSEDSKTVSKIPLLGDIPIIGEFFKHTTHTRDNRELLILITPTLVGEETPVAMSQKMKASYETTERYRRNAEPVDVNVPVKPGTIKEETDLWGGKPGEPDSTVILEEKPAPEGPARLLRTKNARGETVLVPLTDNDYLKRKDELQIVSVEKKDKEIPEDAEEIPVVRRKPKLGKSAKAEDSSDIRSRVRKIMDEYAGN
jgi:pilus assembly protein CpaC